MNTVKISFGQGLILLLICRIFTLMTFVPLIGDGYAFPTQLAAAVISVMIQAVIIIPLILFAKACPQKTVTGAITEKHKVWGIISAVIYLIFFLFYTVNAVLHFMRFLNLRFFKTESMVVMLIVLLAVCVYCACCGVEGLARSAVITLLIFVIMLAVMSVTSAQNFNTDNFYTAGIEKGLLTAVMDDLARNSEIIAAVFLVKYIKDRTKCAMYGLLTAKLAVTEIISVLIIGVLGDFARLTEYPLLSVGSYAGADLFQRNDSLYLVLWTISAVLTIGFFIHICSGLAAELIHGLKYGELITGAVIFIASLFIIKFKADISSVYRYFCGAAATVILGGVIPLLAYLDARKTREKENVGNAS